MRRKRQLVERATMMARRMSTSIARHMSDKDCLEKLPGGGVI